MSKWYNSEFLGVSKRYIKLETIILIFSFGENGAICMPLISNLKFLIQEC